MNIIKKLSIILLFAYFAYINQIKASSTRLYSFYFKKIPISQNGSLYQILNNSNYEGKFRVMKIFYFYCITVYLNSPKGDKDEKAYYELENMVKESKDFDYIRFIKKEKETILKL